MTEAPALAAAAVLLAAGVLKLRDPRTFASTLRKLSPKRVGRRLSLPAGRAIARAIALAEVAAAAGLTLADGAGLRASAVAAVALGAGFTVAVVAAVRRGASCGCFGSLRPKAAGRAEIARAVAVLGAAAVVALWPPARIPLAWRIALVVGGALAARAVAASRLVRARSPKRLAARPAPPVEGAIERLRADAGMREIERRLATTGGTIGWARARVAPTGSALLISAGQRPGAVLTARVGHPGETVTVHVVHGRRRFSLRSGDVVETEVSASPRANA